MPQKIIECFYSDFEAAFLNWFQADHTGNNEEKEDFERISPRLHQRNERKRAGNSGMDLGRLCKPLKVGSDSVFSSCK